MRPVATTILHHAFEGAGGRPVAQAARSDQERLGLVLQSVAVLSHLAHAGWRLADHWSGARVCPAGLLRLPAGAEPGPPRRLPQEEAREFLQSIFGCEERLAGRGAARRAARSLLSVWSHNLVPLDPDALVEGVLETAPFLWEPGCAHARSALVAAMERGDREEVWVAGPAQLRRRLLRPRATMAQIRASLMSPDAHALWRLAAGAPPTGPGADPSAPSSAERIGRAEAWFAEGRFERADRELEGLTDFDSVLLRLSCGLQRGELAGTREVLRRLRVENLTPAQRLRAAELAQPAFCSAGEVATARTFAAEALRVATDGLRSRAQLAMVRAAYSEGDAEGAALALNAARAGLGDPDFDWRWSAAAGMLALQAGDGPGAAVRFRDALRFRRRLPRFEAARLWSDLAIARQLIDDLAGAERGCRNALRLYSQCDGHRSAGIALFNVAELRVRRGRLHGIEEMLVRLEAADRHNGDLRGLVQEAELWARYELARGRAHAARERCDEALRDLERMEDSWHRDDLHALAARAHGWLGDAAEAARHLALSSPQAITRFELEERPALHALAGEREAALTAAAGTPYAELWQGALTGREVSPAAWNALRRIEPFRWARLVCDLEAVAPGFVPRFWLRAGSAALWRAGAGALAERLEEGDAAVWRAIEEYCGGDSTKRRRPAELFVAAGYQDARLVLERRSGPRVLVGGAGGSEELAAEIGGGCLRLSAPTLDAPLRALFRLILRDLPESEDGDAAALGAADPVKLGGMIGASPVLHAAVERAGLLALDDLPLLILGESGTGKELVARHVHRQSPRAAGPFLALNCAALSETLLVSDLFGHVRGAFTGADRDRAGVFEAARGGTVFLDEIGDLPPTAQGMLLRVLQEKELRRVGESMPRPVDVRVVAATHRDLGAMVRAGTFREDLYYRLKVGSVHLPPLRERGDDVLLLAGHFLEGAARGKAAVRLSAAARARLLDHAWPGNVRELENVLQAGAALAAGGVIQPQHLDLPARPQRERGDYHQLVDSYRRRLIADAVMSSGNLADAARQLGLSRQALSYLVRQLEIPAGLARVIGRRPS